MDLNGLWTATFSSGTDDSGGGVVVLLDGTILGGNSSYYYTGSYFLDGPSFKCRMTATPFFGDLSKIFGPMRSIRLAVEGTGTAQVIMAQGFAPSEPSRRINIRMQRVKEFPK
ncbi:MAG TPA: GrlR family regulatory protein [Stellaceae bacterium]|nr:GrlR family regulatory protein [Stellaceae bacterium]